MSRVNIGALREDPFSVKVLVDIDFLLDMRLALMHRIKPNSMQEAFKNGYFQRLSDNFSCLIPGFDNTEYQKQWKERDVSLMTQSIITNFPMILNDLLQNILLDRQSCPTQPHVFVDINFGRYIGLPESHYRAWVTQFSSSLPEEVFVEYRFHPIEHLTPAFINKHYQHLMVYDYAAWMEYHYPAHVSEETLRLNTIMHTSMYFPMLLKGDVELADFSEAVAARGGDFFTELGNGLSKLFAVQFIDSAAVSVIEPKVMEDLSSRLQDIYKEKKPA